MQNDEMQYEEMLQSKNWKPVAINGYSTHYWVSDDGYLINTLMKRMMRGTVNQGKIKISLKYSVDGKMVSFKSSLDRLVAQAFVPNPNSLPEVTHLNGDKLDCRANNLKWTTTRENAMKKRHFGEKLIVDGVEYETKPLPVSDLKSIFRDMLYTIVSDSQFAIKYKIHPRLVSRLRDIVKYLQNEGLILDDGTVDMKWKKFDINGSMDHPYEASPHGLIRHTGTNTIFAGTVGQGGYIYLSLTYRIDGEQKTIVYALAKAIAVAFLDRDPDKNCIAHIDGVQDHEWVDNLKWVTRAELRELAMSRGKWLASRGADSPVAKFTEDQVRRTCELMVKRLPPLEIERKTGLTYRDQYRLRHGAYPDIVNDYDIPKGYYLSNGRFVGDDGSITHNDDPRRVLPIDIEQFGNQIMQALKLIRTTNVPDVDIAKQTSLDVGDIQMLRSIDAME